MTQLGVILPNAECTVINTLINNLTMNKVRIETLFGNTWENLRQAYI